MLNRREFLTRTLKGSSLVTMSAIVPQFVSRTAAAATSGKDNILVVLEMTGGNDGLNTVIPYADDLVPQGPADVAPDQGCGHSSRRSRRPELGDARLRADVGAWAARGRAGGRVSESGSFSLRGDGHLAVGRLDEKAHDGLAGPRRVRRRQSVGWCTYPARWLEPSAARGQRSARWGGHAQRRTLVSPRDGRPVRSPGRTLVAG